MVRCRGCGLLLTWPRPTTAELEALYARAAYYDEHGMGEATAAPAAWEQRAAGILARLPRPLTRALDFGAGQGHLTHALRNRGLAAEGFEPSLAGRQAAQERYRLALWDSLPEVVDPAFELVTLIHSLEHVPHPLLALRQLHSLLAPGGIVYIEVPHPGSLAMWRAERRRELLDLPFHLYHFLPKTLAALVEQAGFQVLQLGLANPAFVERLLSRRQRRPVSLAQVSQAGGDRRPGRLSLHSPPGMRRLWAGAVLPGLRRLLPGDHFHLIAVRPA